MRYSLVYITAKDAEEAREIGKALVEEKMAACTNIIPGAESIYWWKGKVEEAKEAVMILKTKTSLVEDVIKRVKELHSYDVSCVVSLPIEKGNPDYFKWIEEATK